MRLILVGAALVAAGLLPATAHAQNADSLADGDAGALAVDSLSASRAADSLASAPPASGLPLSLGEAEALALSRNERVLIAREEIERTRGLVREVRARALPTLDVNYTYTRNIQQPVIFFNQNGEVQQIRIGSDNDNILSFQLEQTLFSPAINAASRAARISEQVSRLALEDTGEQLVRDVRVAYYTALLGDALVRVQEAALAQAGRRLEQVRRFLEVGTAAEFDVLTAEVEAENIRPQLIVARNDQALALNNLKRLVGIPLEEEVQLTDSLTFEPVEATLEQAREHALLQRDDLRRQEATVQFQQQVLAAERAASFPELSFNLNLSRRASSDEFVPSTLEFSQATSAAVELDIPVFDGRATEGRVRQARAQLNEDEFAHSALRQDIELQVQQSYQSVLSAKEATEAARSTLGRAERALQIAETRFKNGLSTQLELNDAELAVTQSRSTLARALYAYNVARADLQRAMGER
ncbi:MAG TPA: TolC family protein [Gemmatimonadota bacterium]